MRAVEKITRELILIALFFINTSLIAQKYWVSGNGKWSDSSHWSLTSGGSGGASVPTMDEDVIVDLNSGFTDGDSIIITSGAQVQNLDFSKNFVPINFVGDSQSNFLLSGKIFFGNKVENKFEGKVIMSGTSSDFGMKIYNSGEFYGLQTFDAVYKNKIKNTLQTLSVTSLSVTANDATCGCNGSITVSPNDGTGPFGYSWDVTAAEDPDGLGTPNLTNVCPGLYTIQVYDSADGPNPLPYFYPVPIIINGPAPITIVLASNDSVSCNGGSDGQIQTNVYFGAGGYDYEWRDDSGPIGQTAATAVGLSAGNYTLHVTDIDGCTAESEVYTVLEPNLLTTSITSSTNVACYSECTGSATVTPSEGTPGYSYDWYDAGNQTASTAVNLCDGTYHVEVTDNKGCTDTSQITITEPTELKVSIASFTNEQCFNASDGLATAQAEGGVEDYTWDWYDKPGGSTVPNSTGFPDGTYHVEVTDDNGCKDTAQVTITGPSLLTSSIIDTVHILCHGDATGEAQVSASGGTPGMGYSYLWNDPGGETLPRLTNVVAGTYKVIITDANDCLDSSQVTITQPSSPLSSSITDVTHASCNGDCNGGAIVTPSGGVGNYTYNWYDAPGGITDSSITDLCPSTYNVRITDGNGCQDISTVEINQPFGLESSAIITNANCKSVCDGAIDLTPIGGTAGYNFDWYDVPGTPTTEDLTNVCAGTYHVEIEDVNGCLDTSVYTVTEPDTLVGGILTSTNVLCHGDSTGSAVVNETGGVSPYVYTWYDIPNAPGSGVVQNDLPSGIFNIEIEDAQGCKDTVELSITEPALPLSSIISDTVHVLCKNVCEGEAEVTASGGVPDYNYDWYDVPGTPTTNRATNLCDGTYHVEITDLNGCLDTSEVIIVEPATEVSIDVTDSSNLKCNNVCEGEAFAVYTGGTGVLTLDWYSAGNQITDTAFNLCAGPHYVEVTDDNGCKDTAHVVLTEPTKLDVSITAFTNEKCFSASDGTATAEATGGTAPYTWDWYDKPGGSTEPNATGFAPGTYHVEVTDSLGCTDTAEVIITGPTLLTSSIIDTVHILCFGVASGEAEVSASGGTIGLGYTYLWNDPSGETLPRLTNVPAGDYKVYITDSNNCVDSSEVTITEPAEAVNSSITDTTHALCKGDCNGGAIVTPSGGVGNYTYDWYDAPGGITDSTIINLCPGTYNVRTTDGNGCEHISTVILTEPDELTGSTNLTMAKCKSVCDGAIDLTPIGGTPGYSFDWYDFPGTPSTEDLVDVCAGVYNVEIEDGNNCLDTIEVTITEPDSLVGNVLTSTNVLCHGDSTASATISQSGGVDPFNYSWYDIPNAPGTGPTQNDLPSGIFNIQVEDANGCKDTVTLTVTEPDQLTSSISDTVHVLCKNTCSGEAEVAVLGGVPDYSFDWYDVPESPSTARVSGLCDGTYHVAVTDLNGCLDTSEVTITEPLTSISVDIIDSVNLRCNGLCEGKAFAIYSGGTGAIVLDWYSAGNQITDTAFNLCAGANYVEATDENSCKDTAEVFLSEPDVIVINSNPPVMPTCYGLCDGALSVSPIGGTPPYQYNWFDAVGTPTTPFAENQCSGTFNVRVEDSLGCVDTLFLILPQPDSLYYDVDTVVNLLCKDICDGSTSITPVGGTPPFNIVWYDLPSAPTGPSQDNLCGGTWNFEITDNNGCLDSGLINVVEPALELSSSISDTTHNLCFGECTGDATVSANGGTGAFQYDWYNTPNKDTVATAENLCAGTYHVEITDENGCLDTSSVTISEPSNILIDTYVDNSECGSIDTAKASVSVSGGVGPYTYDWYDAGNQTNDTAFGLSVGTYHCEIMDANGCLDTAEIIVSSPVSLNVGIRNDTIHVDCYSNCNGVAVGEISGGTLPFIYNWYDVPGSPSDSVAEDLCKGIYHLEVIDNLGCRDTTEFEIREPDSLILSTDSVEASCFGICDGQASIAYSGGTAPYFVDWLNAGNQSTDTVINLCAGSYNIEVTDNNGCKDTITGVVTAPMVVSSSITDTTHLNCYNDCNGSAIVTPVGGVRPYTYDWFNAPMLDLDSTGNNLCFGTYYVEVSDANGCKDTSEVMITSLSPQITADMDSILTKCIASSDGAAIINVSGGIPGYDLDWFNAGSQTSDTAVGLPKGNYSVEVSDNLGCLDTFSVDVTEPDTLKALISSTVHIECHGNSTGEAVTSPIGGYAPYTYNWFDAPMGGNDSIVTNLPSGVYNVEVVDSNGCIDTGQAVINQMPDVLIFTDSIPATCTGKCTGSAIISVIGGLLPYNYNWYENDSLNNDTLGNVCAGFYNVEVTDGLGCLDTATVEVTEPITISAAAVDSSGVTCYDGNDGWAVVSGSGGTLPYSYWW
ncbi:MAG: hypothetical protein CMP61_07360, partial [Flavobacteriales bacterium]|nr:hypothetical protein [Flavobacteriales bacterium]